MLARFHCVSIAAVLFAHSTAADEFHTPRPSEFATIRIVKAESVNCVRFSPVADSLSYATATTIGTWDRKTKQQRTLIQKPDGRYFDISYSPDGKSLAVCSGRAICHLNIQTGEFTELHSHKETVYCARYSLDGKRIASCGDDKVIKVWDLEKNEVALEMPSGGIVMDLVFIPGTDAVLATTSIANPLKSRPEVTEIKYVIQRIDLKTKKSNVLADPTYAMYDGLSASCDGKYFAVADVDLRVISTHGAELWTSPKCPLSPTTVQFSNSGQILVVGGSTKGVNTLLSPPGEVAVLDWTSNKWISHFGALKTQVTGISVSPKGDFLAVSSTKLGTIAVWDISPLTRKPANGSKENAREEKRP